MVNCSGRKVVCFVFAAKPGLELTIYERRCGEDDCQPLLFLTLPPENLDYFSFLFLFPGKSIDCEYALVIA